MAQLRTLVPALKLLTLLLVLSPSAVLAARHARSPATILHPRPHWHAAPLPLPPKSCQSDDLRAGLETLAGPDVQGNRSAWEQWLRELATWRVQVRESMSYSDERYALHPWTQRNIVAPQMHAFDGAFYTRAKGYTPEAWLDGLLQRYGGVDSLLLWVT